MSFDSRLRDELRRAAAAHDPREEDALRHVKATLPSDWADLTVVALEASDAPRASHVRTQRVVGALAACALLAGAIALPVALRSRSRAAVVGAATPSSSCGPPIATGYRSTAVVRVASAPSASTPATNLPGIKLAEPVQFARGLCNTVLAQSHLRSVPDVGLEATTNAGGDLLSLTVVAPTVDGTTALARNWVNEFAVARKAEAKDQVREQQRLVTQHVQKLHRQLRAVDTKLARLMPGTYGDVAKFDGSTSNFPGQQPHAPPPVPESGTPHALNLAFERIQIISALTKAGEWLGSLRIAGVEPSFFASLVSVSPPVFIRAPRHHTNTSTVLLAVALLTGGVLLAGSAFWLGRRGRRPQSP